MTGRQSPDLLAFAGALLFAPLVVAILGFFAVIPILAVPFGYPTYLLFGGPIFYFCLHFRLEDPAWFVPAGLLAHVASMPLVSANSDSAELIIPFGFLFAPLWGGAFGLLYARFRQD